MSILSDIHGHLWSLLEANPDFTGTFSERRRIKLDRKGVEMRMSSLHQDADMPNIRILPGLPGGGQILDKSKSFGSEGSGFSAADAPLVSREKYQFRIVIVHKSLNIGGDADIDALVHLCYRIFAVSGPQLGMQEINEWAFDRVDYAIKATDEAEETERMVATIQMSMTCLIPVSNYTL